MPARTTPLVYQYPKCSTCRKALKWLAGRGITQEKVAPGPQPPSGAVLRDLPRLSGLPVGKLFNPPGERYRQWRFKERLATLSDAEALAALASDGKLIKRPIVDTGKEVL